MSELAKWLELIRMSNVISIEGPQIKAEFLCKCWLERLEMVEALMIIAYARVSTDGQSLESQLSALKLACAERTFSEKVSGVKTDRRELAKAIASLGQGDVLLVTRLDRLARSTRDLLNVLDAIGKVGAGFRSIADPWADTTTAHGKLMITILGGLAEFERSLILARTGEGRQRAMLKGVRFGRKPKLTPSRVAEAIRRRSAGETQTDIARYFGV